MTGIDHRLSALRRWINACLPGKSLVVFERELGLSSDLVLCEDAYTQERALVYHVLERLPSNHLVVFDRSFTTEGFVFGIAQRSGLSVGRKHAANLPVMPRGQLVKCGKTETGKAPSRSSKPPIRTPAQPCSLRRIDVRLFEKRATARGSSISGKAQASTLRSDWFLA